MATGVLAGRSLEKEDARAILNSSDDEILDLLAATYQVRHHFFGNTVQLFFLMNAKSGLCPEDCGYCSQSKVSDAEIPRYNLLSVPKLLEAARLASERQSKTFCIVISARGPSEREIDFVCSCSTANQGAVQPQRVCVPGLINTGPSEEACRCRG